MLARPSVMVNEVIAKHRLLARDALGTHHALRRRLERLREHPHLQITQQRIKKPLSLERRTSAYLAAPLVLHRQLRNRRAGQRELLLDTPQAEREDGREREVRVHVRAGHADFEARRGGRDGRRRDDAHGCCARVVAVRDRVRRPERLPADEPLVAVDRRDELGWPGSTQA